MNQKSRITLSFALLVCTSILSLFPQTVLGQSAEVAVEVQNALLKTIEATSVAAEVVGKVEQVDVVQGNPVKVGQLLGKIRDSAVELQVAQTKIAMATARKKYGSNVELDLARKRAEVATNELERAQNANATIENTYPPKEVDRLKLVAESAEIEIQRAQLEKELANFGVLKAENEYRQACELLARHRIESPVDGVVVAVNRRVGEWVEPGTEFLQIIKIDRLRIEGFIASAAIDENLVDRNARVTVLKGDTEVRVKGKVVFVSLDANPVNGQVRVYLEIDNRKREFRPGMRVRAEIILDRS